MHKTVDPVAVAAEAVTRARAEAEHLLGLADDADAQAVEHAIQNEPTAIKVAVREKLAAFPGLSLGDALYSARNEFAA